MCCASTKAFQYVLVRHNGSFMNNEFMNASPAGTTRSIWGWEDIDKF